MTAPYNCCPNECTHRAGGSGAAAAAITIAPVAAPTLQPQSYHRCPPGCCCGCCCCRCLLQVLLHSSRPAGACDVVYFSSGQECPLGRMHSLSLLAAPGGAGCLTDGTGAGVPCVRVAKRLLQVWSPALGNAACQPLASVAQCWSGVTVLHILAANRTVVTVHCLHADCALLAMHSTHSRV
jgi:hypothetical protein